MCADDNKNSNTACLGVVGWLNRIDLIKSTSKPLDNKLPEDSLGQRNWLSHANSRLLKAMYLSRPCLINHGLLNELFQIKDDYQVLINAPSPNLPVYTLDTLEVKLADTCVLIASVSKSLGEIDRARKYYLKAMKLYESLGETQHRDNCDTNQCYIDFIEKDSIDHAAILIELARLHLLNGDMHSAETSYIKTEEILDQICGDPSGEKLAIAFKNTLLAISDNQPIGSNELLQVMRVNDLYRILSVGLSRIYKERFPEKAKLYLSKALQRDSQENNEMFSTVMSEFFEEFPIHNLKNL